MPPDLRHHAAQLQMPPDLRHHAAQLQMPCAEPFSAAHAEMKQPEGQLPVHSPVAVSETTAGTGVLTPPRFRAAPWWARR